jgi:hypothetical protein
MISHNHHAKGACGELHNVPQVRRLRCTELISLTLDESLGHLRGDGAAAGRAISSAAIIFRGLPRVLYAVTDDGFGLGKPNRRRSATVKVAGTTRGGVFVFLHGPAVLPQHLRRSHLQPPDRPCAKMVFKFFVTFIVAAAQYDAARGRPTAAAE